MDSVILFGVTLAISSINPPQNQNLKNILKKLGAATKILTTLGEKFQGLKIPHHLVLIANKTVLLKG